MQNSLTNLGPVSIEFDGGTLVLRGICGTTVPSSPGSSSIWQWDDRIGRWRCHAIEYPVVCQALSRQYGSGFIDKVPTPEPVNWPQINLPELRKEQSEALESWLKAGCRGQIIMPTGTGKTEVALAAMAQTRVATLMGAEYPSLQQTGDAVYAWHGDMCGITRHRQSPSGLENRYFTENQPAALHQRRCILSRCNLRAIVCRMDRMVRKQFRKITNLYDFVSRFSKSPNRI
jgi:hypothetical protein